MKLKEQPNWVVEYNAPPNKVIVIHHWKTIKTKQKDEKDKKAL